MAQFQLHTGQPGHGKTLFTIWFVEQERQRRKCAVFYIGIPELTLEGWQLLDDVSKWRELPAGSIVVVDEAWEHFKPIPQGKQAPDWVQELSRHRHYGIDFYVISQSATDIPTFVRKRCSRHINIKRMFGRPFAKLYQWEQVEDERSTAAQKNAIVTRWRYPKELFGKYRSATVHQVRRDFPWRKVGLGVAVAVIAVGGGTLLVLRGLGKSVREQQAAVAPVGSSAPSSSAWSASGGKPGVGPQVDVWSADARKVRLSGFDQSAPLYDSLQGQKSMPSVAGCMRLQTDEEDRCECYSSQGTRLSVDVHACRLIMRNGLFDGTRASRDDRAENVARLDARDAAAAANASGVAGPGMPMPAGAPPAPSGS